MTFTILTTDAAPWVHFVHDRMPVILEGPARELWLDPDAAPADLKEALKPRAEPMVLDPVSTVVNKAANELPECIEPVGPPLSVPPPELTLGLE